MVVVMLSFFGRKTYRNSWQLRTMLMLWAMQDRVRQFAAAEQWFAGMGIAAIMFFTSFLLKNFLSLLLFPFLHPAQPKTLA